jgi:hypothetical protein
MYRTEEQFQEYGQIKKYNHMKMQASSSVMQ